MKRYSLIILLSVNAVTHHFYSLIKFSRIAFKGINISKDNLSLNSLAERFHFSEPYLSGFFKQHMNENFSSYLEQLRMRNAVKLIKSTDKSIREIAEEVGYLSMNTFGRAFKRVFGVNATTYRDYLRDHPAP